MDTVGVSEAAFARALGNRIIEYIPAAVLGDRRAGGWSLFGLYLFCFVSRLSLVVVCKR